MVVALALFFLFAGVAAIVLLHLLVAGRTLRRRSRSLNGPLFPNAADDASPAGLSVAQLKGLPWFEYSGRSASPPWPPPDCTVCLEGFKKGERCRALPSCGHVFHVTCVDRWLAKSRGCPICRALVGVA
ncbi:RING [Musa troglodytarum]|nr:RING [Musa troglodytarum]